MHLIKLYRSLYGLKQFGRMWYNHLSEYLLKEGYDDPFIKNFESKFVIRVIYIDDLIFLKLMKSFQR